MKQFRDALILLCVAEMMQSLCGIMSTYEIDKLRKRVMILEAKVMDLELRKELEKINKKEEEAE